MGQLVLQPVSGAGYEETIAKDHLNDSLKYSNHIETGEHSAGVGTYLRRGLIKFDVSSIPAGVTITSATLSLMKDYDDTAASYTVSIYQCNRNWVEEQACWNNYSTGNAWSTAGGGSGTDYDAAKDGSFPTCTDCTDDVYYDCDLNAAGLATLIGWYEETISNYGWFLIQDVEGSAVNRVEYFGSDQTTAKAPKLTINYTTAATGNFFQLFN